MRGKKWLILLASLALVLLASNIGVTRSFFVDLESSTGNTFQAWASSEWVQTTEDDFNDGVLQNVQVVSPGDVKLTILSDWWDNSYAYRRQLTIQNNIASDLPSGYSVSLILNHSSLVIDGKSQANGDDVRVVYWNGSAYVELDRVAETAWSTASTEIWFQTQAVITGSGNDNNYYLYYGNASAGSPPADPSSVYLWYDDFSTDTLANYDTAKWVDVHGDPPYYVAPIYDAVNQRVTFDTGDNYASDMYPIGLNVADFLMEVDFWADASYPTNATIALVGRLENPGTSSTHYYLDFSHGNYVSPGITVDSWVNGERSNTVYSEGTDYYWAFNQVHTFRYACFEDTHRFWWNKDSSQPPDVIATDSTHTSAGRVGLVPAQVRGWWDNFKVRRYVAPEPTVNVGSEVGMYISLGTIASQVWDTGVDGARWDGLFWDEILLGSTDITFEVRVSDTLFAKDTPDATLPWTSVGGASPVTSGLPSGRYIQWRATLTTSDTSETPVLEEVRVYYY